MSKPRILVIRGGAIGDFVLTLPAIGALRDRFPDAHIEILGYPHVAQLADKRHYADAVRSIDAKPLSGFYIPKAVLDPRLLEYFDGFSLVISYLFDPDHVFADNVRRCGVKHLIEASPRPTELHAAEHYCKPLESLAIYVENPSPRFYPNESDRHFADQFVARALGATPFVVVHPGSGSRKKNWPAEKFASMIRWLANEVKVQVLLVHGEADDEAVATVSEAVPLGSFELLRGLSLVEVAAVIGRAAVFIGNDSGITHLAAATGVPTVALFGPHSPSIWQTRGDRVRMIRFGQASEREVRQVLAEWLGRSSC